uniref:PH domain-containing protein n=1 Tax=Panagrolaimus sp. ES5 TaxID=591445 RepID=A0AC34GBG4_9BILA
MRRPNLSEIEHIAEMDEWNYNSPRCSTIESDRTSDQSFKGLTPEARRKFADIVTLTPPGSLALDVILDYTKRYHQRLKDIQMESNLSSEIWPSIMAHIVRSLIAALSIIPEKLEDQPEVPLRPWLIMFNSERPFHDLFAVALDLFFRTWREMHARGDEDKVLHVVGHQIALGISNNPTSLKDLDDILQKKFSYFHMQKIWEKDRMERDQLELKSDAIRDLQQHLRPTIEELIRTRKKNVLKKGFHFAKVTKGKLFSSDKKVLYHIRLDEHERFLWYFECPDSTYINSKLDFVNKKKLPISDIKRIVTGSEYSETVVQQIGMKLSKKSSSHSFIKQGFSIELKDQSEPLTLATDDEEIVIQWIDGLNLLLGFERLNEKEV